MHIIPEVLHTPWCDPACHHDAGDMDQFCHSAVWSYEALASKPADRQAVSVSVERYAVRPDGAERWTEDPPRVCLEVTGDGFAVLLPDEVLVLVQRLLSACSVANGTAVAF